MDRLRKIGVKIGVKRSGSGRDKTLRHSRSMPFRNSSETESSSISSGRQSNDIVLNITATPFSTTKGRIILKKKPQKEVLHEVDCDCKYCEDGALLGQFPIPPPRRPLTRPPDMDQDFDDVLMMPDDVYEMRRKIRDREREEGTRSFDSSASNRVRIGSNNTGHLQFGYRDANSQKSAIYGNNNWNRSTRSLGPNVYLSGGPVTRRPVVQSPPREVVVGSWVEVTVSEDISCLAPVQDTASTRSVRSLSRKKPFKPRILGQPQGQR